MSYFIHIFTAVFVFTVSTNSFADNPLSHDPLSDNKFSDDLFAILKRMSDADHSQNYQGTFILRKTDNLSTLQVTHGVDEKGDWENLKSLSGESRNVYRQNKQIVTVYPEREIITLRYTDEKRSLHPKLPSNLDQLELFYSMKRLDDDRIANHQAVVVDLLPIDQYRYGYRYWVDKNTGMLLRCDLFNEDKSVIEQMMFTSLDYLTESPARSFDLKQFDQFEQHDVGASGTVEQMGENLQWAVNTLPKGFMLTHSIMRNSQPQQQVIATSQKATAKVDSAQMRIKENDLLHMVYSDGLASVSVFVEKNKDSAKHLRGASSMGAVNAYGNSVGDYFVTVVGEVPAKTVRAMAQSVFRIH